MRDTARLLDAVHGPGVGDTVIAAPPSRPYVEELGVDPGRLRIGLLDTHPTGGALHADCVVAVRSAAALLEGLGHDVSLGHPPILEDREFPRRFAAMWAALMAVGIEALGTTIGREMTADDIEPVNWAQGEYAGNLSATQYAMALAAVGSTGARCTNGGPMDGTCSSRRRSPHHRCRSERCTTPTTGSLPTIRWRRRSVPGQFVAFTPQFNATGQPAINLPLHWNDAGLPDRSATRGRLRPRRPPHSGRQPARSRRPLGPPPPTGLSYVWGQTPDVTLRGER